MAHHALPSSAAGDVDARTRSMYATTTVGAATSASATHSHCSAVHDTTPELSRRAAEIRSVGLSAHECKKRSQVQAPYGECAPSRSKQVLCCDQTSLRRIADCLQKFLLVHSVGAGNEEH